MARPQRPISRTARTVSRRCVATTRTNSASAANTARPATCVAGSASSSRCASPAVDQADGCDEDRELPLAGPALLQARRARHAPQSTTAPRPGRPRGGCLTSARHLPLLPRKPVSATGSRPAMHVFTKRNALVGWIVTRNARKTPRATAERDRPRLSPPSSTEARPRRRDRRRCRVRARGARGARRPALDRLRRAAGLKKNCERGRRDGHHRMDRARPARGNPREGDLSRRRSAWD